MSPEIAGSGLAHLAGLIRSLSALAATARDSSQMCRRVCASRPVPTLSGTAPP